MSLSWHTRAEQTSVTARLRLHNVISCTKTLNYCTAGRLCKFDVTHVPNLWSLVVIGRMCFQETALQSTRPVHTKADIYCSQHTVNSKGAVGERVGLFHGHCWTTTIDSSSFMVTVGPIPSTVSNTVSNRR